MSATVDRHRMAYKEGMDALAGMDMGSIMSMFSGGDKKAGPDPAAAMQQQMMMMQQQQAAAAAKTQQTMLMGLLGVGVLGIAYMVLKK